TRGIRPATASACRRMRWSPRRRTLQPRSAWRSGSARRLHERPIVIHVPPRRVLRLSLLAAATTLMVVAGEIVLRIADGYVLSSPSLVAKPGIRADARSASGKWLDPEQAAAYVHSLPVASGVARSWYRADPAPRREMPIDPEIHRRYWADPS